MRIFRVYLTDDGEGDQPYEIVHADKLELGAVDRLAFYRESGQRGTGNFKREVVAYFTTDSWTHFVEVSP